MLFRKKGRRASAQARSVGATGQVQKRKKSVKRSPPVAMEVKILALEALESGLSANEVGELVGVGFGTIHKWRKDYAETGVQGLCQVGFQTTAPRRPCASTLDQSSARR